MITFRCGHCGSANVETMAWIRTNTNTVVDDAGDDEYWCEDCKELERTYYLVQGADLSGDLYAHLD